MRTVHVTFGPKDRDAFTMFCDVISCTLKLCPWGNLVFCALKFIAEIVSKNMAFLETLAVSGPALSCKTTQFCPLIGCNSLLCLWELVPVCCPLMSKPASSL